MIFVIFYNRRECSENQFEVLCTLPPHQPEKFENCAHFLINPKYHGPLKLLNCHGLDGKSWFKKEGPLWALGRDYKVVSTVPTIFSLYCT